MVEFPRSDVFVKRERDEWRFAHGGSALSWHLYNIVSVARASLFFLSPGMVSRARRTRGKSYLDLVASGSNLAVMQQLVAGEELVL